MAWELWRQDDHGNEYLIKTFAAREVAEEARDTFITRGHHQHYWVKESSGDETGPKSGGGDPG
jgi:hypothetical protein